MPQTINTTVEAVTERIRTRSQQLRQTYLRNAQQTMARFLSLIHI